MGICSSTWLLATGATYGCNVTDPTALKLVWSSVYATAAVCCALVNCAAPTRIVATHTPVVADGAHEADSTVLVPWMAAVTVTPLVLVSTL